MSANVNMRGSPGVPRPPAGEAGIAGTLDLKPLVRLLRWRARLIALTALAVVAIAAALLIALPPKYKATAVVLLDPRETRVTASESVLSGIGNDAAAVESQVEVVQSPVLARRVIDELQLANDPEFASPPLLESVAEQLGFPMETTPEQRTTRLLDTFGKGLRVSRRGLSYILEINFVAKTPEKAARIANAVAHAYIGEQQRLRRDLTENASAWLDGRIHSMRERLTKSEQAVADYKNRNNVVDVLQGGRLIQRRMEDVSRELAVAQLRKAEVGGRLQQIEAARSKKGDAAAVIEALQSQTITVLRSRYADAAATVARYTAMYGRKHPSLISARAQLAEAQQQLDDQVVRVVEGLRDDYAAASKQQATLEGELAKLKEQSGTQEQASVQLAALTREAEADRALFNQYLGRLKQTDQEQTLRFDNARIVSPALPPLLPNRPGAILLLLAAGLGGVTMGIGAAVLNENVRSGLRGAHDVENGLGTACLGILPVRTRSRSRRGQAGAALPEYTRGVVAIASRLQRGAGSSRQVLLITSVEETRSEFPRDLAVAFAATGARTLLVDANSGGPAPIPASADDADAGARVTKVANSGAVQHLYAAQLADTALPSAAGTKQFGVLLQENRQAFDVIVVDAPRVGAAGVGRLIDLVDHVVVTAAWDATDRADVADTIALLEAHDRKLAGVVLTEASPRWHRLFAQGRSGVPRRGT